MLSASRLPPDGTEKAFFSFRRWPVLIGSAFAALCFAVWPAVALAATPRPAWNPGPPWAPLDPKSGEMHQISNLFWIMLVLSAIVFAFVAGWIVIAILRFSARPGEPEPTQVFGNRRVEVTWTAIPFLILIVAFFFTVKGIHDINTPPAKLGTPLDVYAIGHQWWWEFRIPAYKVETAEELHVPVNTSLHFHIESADVVHSFWVPQMQRQIDANPGQDNAVFVVMNTPGTYGGACYEYCGDGHAWMKFELVVQPMTQFTAWASLQARPEAKPHGVAALGQKVFLSHTCVNCHAITGTTAGGVVGPNLTHVASRWAIGGGSTPLDAKDLAAWIRSPDTYKPGVLMPPYPLLSAKDLHALTTYLLSLK